MANIKKFTDLIRRAIEGKEVRGSLADGLDAINKETENATDLTIDTERRQTSLEQQFTDVIKNDSVPNPSNLETVASRTNTNAGKNYGTLGKRLDAENKEVTQRLAENTDDVKESKRRESSLSATITIIIDDGRIEDYTICKRFTERYSIPFTSALISSRVGSANGLNMSLAQINELKDLGWEFISHTENHPHLSELATEEEIEAEIKNCADWLDEHGFNSDYLVYPFSSHDNRVMRIAAKYHKASFTGRGINFAPTKPSQALSRVVFGGMDNLPGQDTLEFYLSQVDEAIAGNGWLVFVIHSAYPSFDAVQQGYLEKTIEYAQLKGVPFKHVADAYPVFKNVQETIEYTGGNTYNYTALGANGDIYASKPLSTPVQTAQISRTRNVTMDARIDEIDNLPPGSHREELLHNVDDHGFPIDIGRLKMFRAPENSDESFSYQDLHGHDGTSLYRYWQTSNDKWSSFKVRSQISYTHIKNRDSLTLTMTPEDFEIGTTICEISAEFAVVNGFPGGLEGLFVTVKPSETGHGHVDQYYKLHRSNRKIVRSGNFSTNWRPFFEINMTEFTG